METVLVNGKEYRIIPEFDGTYFISEKTGYLVPSIHATSIKFDEENQAFLLRDVIEVEEGVTVNLYHYLDLEFMPIGFAYNDLTEGFVSIPYDEEIDFEVTYQHFKEQLKLQLKEQLSKRRNHFFDINKKMLSISKKKGDE